MSESGPTTTVLRRLRYPLSSRLGIDTRALATFRIGIGTILILDLLLRARSLRMFYTDTGVLPVSVLAEQSPTYARISLHALSGELWFQCLLFTIATVAAIALVVGYQTRIATGVSFVLLLSLHARNPHVLNGGDALLQHLTFWSLFLPLGSRWSVDADRRGGAPDRIVSVASAALLTQVVLVYGVNAVLKFRSDLWLSGDAVTVILGLDRFTVLLGPLLRELPLVLELVNWAWVGLLAASPLLVLSTGRARTASVVAFGATHLGMLLTMDLGVFPLVSITALIPFLPSSVWNGIDRSRVLNRLRTSVPLRPTRLNGKLPGGETGPSVSSAGRRPDRISRAVVVAALTGVVLFNAIALGFVPVPPPADDTLSGEYADPRWAMFAPHPPTANHWYVAVGARTSGDRVDPFHRAELQGGGLMGTERFPSARLRKYTGNLRSDRNLHSPFAAHLCDRWSRSHGDELAAVSVYAVETPSLAPKDGTRERSKLLDASCETRR